MGENEARPLFLEINYLFQNIQKRGKKRKCGPAGWEKERTPNRSSNAANKNREGAMHDPVSRSQKLRCNSSNEGTGPLQFGSSRSLPNYPFLMAVSLHLIHALSLSLESNKTHLWNFHSVAHISQIPAIFHIQLDHLLPITFSLYDPAPRVAVRTAFFWRGMLFLTSVSCCVASYAIVVEILLCF